jgi:hypothetical protein
VRDGTVVAAHYQGFRSYALGKSKGCKPHDLAVADLCHKCHALFDNYDDSLIADPCMRKIDHSERFLFYILLTLVRRMQQEVLHD